MPTDIMFTTSPSEWTKLEGLYVAQQKQEGQITGANVNTVGLFGTAVRGPTTPQVCSDPSDFLALYGGRDNGGGGAITGGMWKALLNRKFSWPMVTNRVAASAAVAASVTLATSTPTNVLTVTATSVGTWANNASGTGVSVTVSDASDADANHFNLTVKYGGQQVVYKNLDIHASGVDNTSTVVGTSPYSWITLTKIASGRPVNAADSPLASGTDGTVVLADYESAFDAVAATAGVRIVACTDVVVDESNTKALAGYIAGKAGGFPLSTFCVWDGANNTYSDEISEKPAAGALPVPLENIVWCYNASSTADNTGTMVETGCHLDMASILSMTDVAIHPGDESNKEILAGRKKLANESLTRGALIALRAAGISTLEKVDGGFLFHSAVASNSTGGIGDDTSVEVADVRRRQWLIESIAKSIRHDVKKPATASRRAGIIAKCNAFCREDQKAEHVVAPDDKKLGPAFQFQFVETPQERARNIAKLMSKIRILPYNLTIVLMTDIGTGVTTVAA